MKILRALLKNIKEQGVLSIVSLIVALLILALTFIK